jgi:D-3-phosphoglycerate dehydrogenase
MRVIFFDIEDKLPLGNASQVRSMDELLAQANVVSLHVPETPQTKDMFAKAEFAKMRQGSFFINASRGTVVDIEDLAQALKSEHLAGAAIDVFPVEPKSNDDEFITPLRGLDNVLLTPHIGGSTAEAQENIGVEVAGKLVKYSDNGSTLSAVNFPEVSLSQHSGTSRLLHIHHNRPGVLIKINQAFSEKHINIAAQYLQTTAQIGYVVMEVDSDQAEEALVELKSIEGTIRARVLF